MIIILFYIPFPILIILVITYIDALPFINSSYAFDFIYFLKYINVLNNYLETESLEFLLTQYSAKMMR